MSLVGGNGIVDEGRVRASGKLDDQGLVEMRVCQQQAGTDQNEAQAIHGMPQSIHARPPMECDTPENYADPSTFLVDSLTMYAPPARFSRGLLLTPALQCRVVFRCISLIARRARIRVPCTFPWPVMPNRSFHHTSSLLALLILGFAHPARAGSEKGSFELIGKLVAAEPGMFKTRYPAVTLSRVDTAFATRTVA